MRGRKPTPTALKIVRGNPGKRPLNEREPKPKQGRPTCPPHLDQTARAEWRRLSKILSDSQVLTLADRGVLAAYCVAWSRWVEAEEQVAIEGEVVKSPKGYPIQNPYLAIANRAIDQMIKIGASLGLDPSSRSRLNVETGKEEDPFEAFLNRRNKSA